MDITIALQRAVKSFPHGSAALAARLGMSPSSLMHKVSPTYPSAHCGPEELADIMEITGDHSALHALAMRLGYVVIPAGAEEGADPCMQALANMVQEFGQFAAEAASNLSDGQVTDNELRRIEREGAEALAAINRLLGVAAALNREGKPAAQAALNEQKSDRARARR